MQEGTALGTAAQLRRAGKPAGREHDANSDAFFHGFQASVYVAVAIALAGAVMALVLIPSQPPSTSAAMAG